MAESQETPSFETTRREQPVRVDGKDYVIRELDGQGLTKWRKMDGSTITVQEDGTASMTGINIKDPEVELLSLCLFDDQGRVVPRTLIQTWPSRALQGLFKIAQDVSGLSKESRKKVEQEAKNS